jgi:cytokinesis protein
LNRHKTDSEEDLALLHAADRFLVELIKFDNLQLRVEGMLCRALFDEAFSILDANTSQFNLATTALQNAHHFSGLLNVGSPFVFFLEQIAEVFVCWGRSSS